MSKITIYKNLIDIQKTNKNDKNMLTILKVKWNEKKFKLLIKMIIVSQW